MQARNSSPFRPGSIFSKSGLHACGCLLPISSLIYKGTTAGTLRCLLHLQQHAKGCGTVHSHPVHMLRSCCGQVHSLPFLPERSPALQKESPLPQYHISHLKSSTFILFTTSFLNHQALQRVCRSGYPASHLQ